MKAPSLSALVGNYGADAGTDTPEPGSDDEMATEVVSYLDDAMDPSLSTGERYDAFKQAMAACK